MQKAFTPRSVARLRQRAEQTVAVLLDDLAAAGDEVVDLLDAYARPLPITMLCDLLGIPESDRRMISATVADYDKPERAARVTQKLGAYFDELIAVKRAKPGQDVLSGLAGEDGLTNVEARSLAFQLVMAGFDTTVNLIGNGILALLTHPTELARLRADPSVLPAAVEELLRFTNPVRHSTDRFTTQETTIGDVVIPQGEWVFIVTSSANYDPAQFPDPERLDFDRNTSAHLAFGHGIHYCLGASLARMEAEVAFGALIPRFPGLSLAVSPEQLRWRAVSLMHGLESLPVRLGARS
ncbi:cytochrome P450 family protein [Fodinicola acaciae]|uniref:cytochrome P450 family protein n=1 Tax=Fodinicola acaciae TaxID=2681555 RepID=UPI001C9E27E5|nr:cytochrome P450 [Fodinicola acaciae]